ncbi:MAG: hypothetical protein ACWA40_07425 [Planktomarina sp.]
MDIWEAVVAGGVIIAFVAFVYTLFAAFVREWGDVTLGLMVTVAFWAASWTGMNLLYALHNAAPVVGVAQ